MNVATPPAGTPAAELAVDADLARQLLSAQHPDLADLPIRIVGSGWDNAMFRLGEDLALRLPRRASAAQLLVNEQTWLPRLKDQLPLPIPAPIRTGLPSDQFPWPWSITPWMVGETADLSLPNADQGECLAGFFRALHRPAPAEAPRNPVRGVPLTSRIEAFQSRLPGLGAATSWLDGPIMAIWEQALAAPDDAEPTWIHGDLHPRNVLVDQGRLSAIIDWGDMAQGDRASDLAAVWMLLPDFGAREAAIAGCPEVSQATWQRARGWAVLYGVMLMSAGLIDDPRMVTIAERIFGNLRNGP